MGRVQLDKEKHYGRAFTTLHHKETPTHHNRRNTDATTSKTVLIGPEGGFIDYEVDLARKLGAIPVSLGHRIFSVDTAVCTALARDLT